jgi:hypothetical protein
MAVVRTRVEVAEIISSFLHGSGSAWAWDDFISVRIEDLALDAIRVQCAELPGQHPPTVAGHYCGAAGMEVLRSLAEQLRRAVV